MKITNRLLLFAFILFNYSMCFSQDTTFIDKKINYYKEQGDLHRIEKGFLKIGSQNVSFAKEKIKLSNDSFKIEHCYYYENKRFTNGLPNYYKFHNGNTLSFDNEQWNYTKNNDTSYTVIQFEEKNKRIGNVKSLVPFIKSGIFVSYNSNNDTVFVEKYINNKLLYFDTPQIQFKDSVYSLPDIKPKFPWIYGDLNKYISLHLHKPFYARESSIAGKIFIQFIVSSNGNIKNIKILRGIDPTLDMEAARVISKLPNFEPGVINGKNVNSFLIIPVNFVLY